MINAISHSKRFLAALIMGCFFLYSCENDINEVRGLSTARLGVEEGKQIESFMSQGGRIKARLTAPLMLRYQLDSTMVEFPKTLHVDFYDSLKQVESQLNARYGRYVENQSKVFLRDSVVVFNRMGDTLWCKELWWDQNRQLFYTDKPVKIKYANPWQLKYGTNGMQADQSFSNITIFQSSGTMILPDSTYY